MSDERTLIEEKVAEWLGTQGYRLEYLTHKAMDDAGLGASISDYIENGDGTFREIDVSASKYCYHGDGEVHFRWIGECKYSEDKPWVMLTANTKSRFTTN